MNINSYVKAAKNQINLMSQLACIEHGLAVKDYSQDGVVFNDHDSEWLKCYLIRNAFFNLQELNSSSSIDAYKFLLNGLTELGSEKITEESNLAFSKIQQQLKYKIEFQLNFDRKKKAASYKGEAGVPSGDVHYIISYRYSYEKNMYEARRNLAIHHCHEYELWFDYYGPEEDENGLIQNIDY